MLLEICVDSPHSYLNAVEGGADRVELCSSLGLGGLTPSLGFLRFAKANSAVPVFPMLRPREGHFVYTKEEMEVVLSDAEALKTEGADGFVFGALTSDGTLNREQCAAVMRAVAPLPLTLHRAIDVSADWGACVEAAVDVGFSTILSSGAASTAAEGVHILTDMRAQSDGRIEIMAGSGVCVSNVEDIVRKSGVRSVHGSASVLTQSLPDQSKIKMGTSESTSIKVTSIELVREIKKQLNSLSGK